MKKVILLVLFLFTILFSYSAAVPAHQSPPGITNTITPGEASARFSKLKMKEVEKLLGRKLSLKEKIAVKIYQWKLRKSKAGAPGKTQADKGKTAMWFGIAGLVFILAPIPYFGGLIAITSIILALVLGYQAKKANPKDKKAKTAIILGWIGVGVIVAAIILVIAILATWTGGWG